jgi:hypothetical protein
VIDAINKRNVSIQWKSIQFDLVSEVDIQKVKLIIGKSDLLVIQNCLNEIASTNLPALKTNLKLLLEYLPGTCLFPNVRLNFRSKASNESTREIFSR